MKLLLNDDWQMTMEPLSCDSTQAYRILSKSTDWLEARLPCDVHMPLIENGRILEPLVADNCFKCEWTEERSFWFKKRLAASPEQLAAEHIELTLESLDAEADIWLNGVHLGHQRSAFYPFTANIKPVLQAGENTLLVRVTSGLEHYSKQDVANTYETAQATKYDNLGWRGDELRVMVRKPQYVFGWDWGPRVASCGIMKNVWIEFSEVLRIRSVHAVTEAVKPIAAVRFDIELERLHAISTGEAEVQVDILYRSELVAQLRTQVYMRSGLNFVTLRTEIPQAKLWWPNGMGDQPLYTVEVTAASERIQASYPAFKIGLRTIEMNTDKISDDERMFAFVVNDVPVFSKGSNWVPADSIYARITDGKYETLIREAKDAHFNMLRIWGGGIYERDIFYEKCDEYGILIWHDFMFACAKYPDHLPWFREEVEREIDYQTKRLRNHCAIALWCGNNENQTAHDEWSWKRKLHPDFFGGAIIYNEIAPRAIQRNCPEIPYWNSSPYGGEHPNGNEQGDRHHWWQGAMNPDVEIRTTPEEYDKVTAKFVSEYGIIGPCRRSSIETYHGDHPLDIQGALWKLHRNVFERDTILAGICKHYTDIDIQDIDGYLLYGGLFQGLMLGHSLESFRSRLTCSGGLFWMYNDTWGESGWTIIDYYLKRKISYYFVKRAFEPTKLIVRKQDDGKLEITAINETNEAIGTTLEYGIAGFDGTQIKSNRMDLVISPRSRTVVQRIGNPDADLRQNYFYVKSVDEGSPFRPAYLRTEPFRNLATARPHISVTDFRLDRDAARFTLTSDKFAHAVHFNLPDDVRLNDEYFDLFPGVPRNIAILNPPRQLTAETIRPVSL